ncbi:LCP family protein [Streptomyces sp. NPDC051569]|uniref:LCP family protein n=1 Tax=Streptomyces sp. NPDC051569 TaxID=3365661 RepID=UPI0037983E75
MDADVTEGAGTPAEPNNPAGPEPQDRAPGSEDNGTADPTPEAAAREGSGRTEPGGTEPEETEPGETEPGETEPGETEPGETEPEKTGPGETDTESPGPEPEGTAGPTAPEEATAPEEPGHREEPADPEEPADREEAEGPEEPDGAAAPEEPLAADDAAAPLRRTSHWLRWVALGASVSVLAASGAGWWFYQKLDGNITTDTTAAAELHTYEKERPTPVVLDAQNILLLGSDSRSGQGNSKYGGDDGGSQRSDTTILLHLAADRQSATAVSVPRDLMVEIPSCRRPDGTRTKEQFAQFNWAFEFGGAACTIRTVENLTGIRVDHHMVIDFHGFKGMVDAVGGVGICLKEPVDDKQAKLKLPAGPQTLDGEQALGFVRARHGIGDGSDTERMGRQQRFLGSLFKKVQSDGVLLNPTRLYPVLDAATKSITTDAGLATLTDLYDLARSMRNVPIDQVRFLTVPRQPYTADPNRDELVQPDAKNLFERLRGDEPVIVSPSETNGENSESAGPGEGGTTDGGSREKPGGTGTAAPVPTPTFSGSNAAAGVCE